MGVKRVWSTAGVVGLTGALLLTSAPVASADYIRDAQWPLTVYNAEKVWSTSKGAGATVAVVDTGVNASHPDLTGQVLSGKDFTGEGDPHRDRDGHGTGMASLIAGHGHGVSGSAGVMGLAPKAKILPVRAPTSEHDMNTAAWAEGVRYAVDQGASVINLSFNDHGAYPGSKGAKAIQYAQKNNVVVVAGTGNDGGTVNYPAALPGVVAVTAIDESLNLWDDSNIGKGVTLAAPGAKIPRADPPSPGGYANASGTSDATAYVSAIAALIRSKYPDLTAGQVINRMIKSASFVHHGDLKAPDDEYGYGIARPGTALTMDIPKGPKEGPLAQAPSSTTTNSGKASEGNGSSANQAKKKKSSSSGILVIAGIAAVVVIGGIVFAVIRSRRNRGNGGPGGGTHPQDIGYPNQPPYPTAQQPYPTAAPGQARNSNLYGEQPPHQGQ
ncbi:type VII secretion-associated serine protease mycosin [Streptomyces flavidovirens]|uniref:type VII secretion-associated serine protease mycosin n=1 Tax=Streptomyces flavidovirens TaxID=67298 RepID=UPI0034381ED7